MGGYDCLLFRAKEKLPENPGRFWRLVKKKMFEAGGYDQNIFNSIWKNGTFKMYYVGKPKEPFEEKDLGLWGLLDW